jgi:hypothetical protein
VLLTHLHAYCSGAINWLSNYWIHIMTYPQPLVIPRNKDISLFDLGIVAFWDSSIHQIGD